MSPKKRTCIAAVAASLMLSQTPSAAGQSKGDPVLCASLKSILAAAPRGQWPATTAHVLKWDGGSRKCVSSTDGKTLSCAIFNTQMLAGCRLVRAPSAEEASADAAARAYANARLMPAINACLEGAVAEVWQIQDDARLVQGLKISPAGLAPFRFGEGKARIGEGNEMCGWEFVEFQIDAVE